MTGPIVLAGIAVMATAAIVAGVFGVGFRRGHREPGTPFAGAPRDAGPPRGRGQKARQDAHRGGLPGAIGAQEPDDLALPDREAHVVHGQAGRVSLRQILNFDHADIKRKPR